MEMERRPWTPSSCFRHWPARALFVVVGCMLACGIGVVLWRGAFQSMEEELHLKCENRKEVLKSEVENSLNASFVILGLMASVPEVDEAMWVNFADRTLFLRPNVRRLVYVERVLARDRAAFEQKWSTSILYVTGAGATVRRADNDTEYSPIVFETDDEHYRFVDSGAYPLYRNAIDVARDTGLFTLSSITRRSRSTSWYMGAYLAYYGPGRDYTSFASVEARRNACIGYVGSVFNATDLFHRVLVRFTDDVDMDVVAVFVVDPLSGLYPYFKCSATSSSCVMPLFDPARRASEVSKAAVSWEYGTQHFEVRCLPKQNLKLLALRAVIAWPLLMLLLVIFFYIIVYLVLKRMQAIEKDVVVMEKMNEDLKLAKLAAEAADKAKSNFLATVSHEIRTPMNGVIGMTNLLMGTDLTAQQLEYVKVAQASGNSLIELINDVLDLSKIEAGRMELESVAFNIRKEVDSVFHLFDEKVRQKKLEMSMLVHDTVPTCIVGDPGRFRQILGNLIGNSLKFTKEGSIIVCVRVMDYNQEDSLDFAAIDINKKIASPGEMELLQVLLKGNLSQAGVGKLKGNTPPRLSIQPGSESNCKEAVEAWRKWKLKTTSGSNCTSPPDYLTIVTSVEDTGIGIPHHLEQRLFQPFSQANSSTVREHGGTGIGLSICQKLVKLMNGDITVTSKVGSGSVFEFTLPVNVSDVSVGIKPCCSVFPLEDKRLNGMHVTLVDSNLVRQEVSASYLRCLGIHVELAEDVQSTLEILKSGGAAMQAILIDLEGFPSASVAPLASSIRNISTLKALPVLALSLGVPPAAESELKDSGVCYIVDKPLRYSTLASVLLEAIGVLSKAPPKKLNNVNDDANLLSGKRLLVVDDNMVNRRVATSMLKKYGAIVSSVNGGGEAVAVVKNQTEDDKLDLVLMDIQMPEMDGWEATRRIRSWEVENCNVCRPLNVSRCDHHRLPIVAVTADALKGTHEECMNSGMDDYLTKPLDQKHLHALLERFVRNEMHHESPSNEQLLVGL